MKQQEYYKPPQFGKNNVRQPIPLFTVFMSPEVDKPLLDVLHSGFIGQGAKVEEFEEMLGGIFQNKNVLTLNSGTSALHLAFRLADVKPGAEVITTPMTCTATNMPILANGGKIVWADVDPNSGLIDPVDVERKITDKTVAIVGVDWGGTPCDWDELNRIAKKYGLKTIEDGAHSMGMKYKGRPVGTLADFTIFSFQAIKHITTVDGGALIVRDSEDYKRGKLLRWYGIDRETERKDFRCEEDIVEWGYKFHMNDVTAVIGLEQFKHLPKIAAAHKNNAKKIIDNCPNFDFATVSYDKENESGFWLLTLLLPNLQSRIEFMRFMTGQGIVVSQVHARNDKHTCFSDSKCVLPGVDRFVERQVSIPVHWSLTDEELNHIIKSLNDFHTREEITKFL